MATMRLLLVVLAIVVAGCGAKNGADQTACTSGSGDPDTIVAACTRLLDGGAGAPASQRINWLVHRGFAKQRLGDAAGATADVEAAVALDPRNAQLLANRAALHGQQGRLEESLRDADAALAIDPNNLMALGNRAIALERLGRYRDALATVNQAMAIDTSSPSLWAEHCWISTVLADDLPRALADCEQALAMDPGESNNHNNLGFVHFRLGDHAKAIYHYDQALAKKPDVASSWFMRGLARRARGDEAGAASDIAKGLALEPDVAARYAGYGVDTGEGAAR